MRASTTVPPLAPPGPHAPLAPDITAPARPGAGWRSIRRPLRWVRRHARLKTILITFAALGSLSAAYVYFGPVSLRNVGPLQNAILYDAGGNVLAELRPEQNREVVPLSHVPLVVQNAFIAAEDERFWSHFGIDPMAIMRAVFADAKGDRQGASTITQQYVRNTERLNVGTARTVGRKIKEAITAIRIDRRYSKKQILEGYLNSIYLGNGAYGVQAASKLYFSRDVADLSHSLEDAALLAGITANPTAFDPRLYPERARERRDYVLHRMLTLHYITPEQEAAAEQQPVTVAARKVTPVTAPGFVDWVRSLLVKQFGEDGLYRGGLRVHTTLDLDIQRTAQEAIAEKFPNAGDPDVSVVVMDAATGSVIAMVGGRNDQRLGDLNLATQGRRQPGSAFKPFVLAAALEQGKTLDDRYRAPGSIRLKLPDETSWLVRNYDRSGYGRPTLKRALAYSVNTVFAQLIRDVGPDSVVDVAKAAGVSSPLRPVFSLALGTSEVTPLDLATGYSTFAREGDYLSTTGMSLVSDGSGKTLFRNDGNRTGHRVMPASVADSVIEGLTEVVAHGTGYSAAVKVRAPADCSDGTLGCSGGRYVTWGKTGTTEDHADAWFVGGVGGYVTAVWVGHPQGRISMGSQAVGGSYPAPIWKKIMTAVLEKYRPVDDAASGKRFGGGSHHAPSALPTAELTAEPSPTPTESRSQRPPNVKLPCPPFCGAGASQSPSPKPSG